MKFKQNLANNSKSKQDKSSSDTSQILENNDDYHNSKIFNASNSLNPLTTAAIPLLIIVDRLKNNTHINDKAKLLEKLVSEIKVFTHKIQDSGYNFNTITASRYSLCCLIDEVIENTKWGKDNEWNKENLLNIFQHETYGGETFFKILEQISADPGLNIDLLEFMYICLTLGFEGKYRNEQTELDALFGRLMF